MNRYNLGEQIYLLVELFDEFGDRVSGAVVNAFVKKPDGSVIGPFLMTEDTFFSGVYRYTLSSGVDIEGVYSVKYVSEGFPPEFDVFIVKNFSTGGGGGGGGGGGDTGVYRVDMKVVNNFNEPIPEVYVSVYSSEGVFIGTKLTDVNGNTTFYLNQGDYKVRCVKSGVALFDEYSIVGLNSDKSITITGNLIVIPPPSVPGLVRIYGNLRDLNLNVRSADIYFEVYRPPRFAGDAMIVLASVHAVVNPQTGDFYADIAKGVHVAVVCKDAGLSSSFITPVDKDVVKLKDLLGL